MGRTIIFFLGFWGIFVISLFVVTIRNVLEISNEENRTLNLLLRLNYRDALRKEAAKVITTFAKVRSNKRRFSGVKSKQSMLNYKEKISMIKLKRFMNKFSQTQKFFYLFYNMPILMNYYSIENFQARLMQQIFARNSRGNSKSYG